PRSFNERSQRTTRFVNTYLKASLSVRGRLAIQPPPTLYTTFSSRSRRSAVCETSVPVEPLRLHVLCARAAVCAPEPRRALFRCGGPRWQSDPWVRSRVPRIQNIVTTQWDVVTRSTSGGHCAAVGCAWRHDDARQALSESL